MNVAGTLRRAGRLHRVVVLGVVLIVLVGTGCVRGRRDDAGPPTTGTVESTVPTTSGAVSGTTAGSTVATPPTPMGETAPPRPAVEPRGAVTHGELTAPDGRVRTYRLYMPAHLPDGPVPLLIALHGGLGWGDQFAGTNHYEAIAEANGFIVVHPDGVRVLDAAPSATWNGGYCCGPAAKQDVDDVGFLTALLDRVEAEHDVDPARVFASGHSNGGIMSYRLACELSDRIVGIGVVGASLGVEPCTPGQPVSLIHVHGTADRNHPIDGGVGDDSIAQVDFHPAIDGVHTIATADGCPDAPTSTASGDLTVDVWSPCDAGAAVEFVRIAGASHAWPGGTGRTAIAGPTYVGYDASFEIWSFLIAHPRR